MPKRVRKKDEALPPAPPEFREYMRLIGRKGGQTSGARRMTNLTPKQRSAVARIAAKARWNKKKVDKTA